MKKNLIFGLIGMAFLLVGCSNSTYWNQRKEENKLIANYISRNGLQIVYEEPAEDHVWGEKEYYKVSGYDDFYYHQIERGDTMQEVKMNDLIIVRYKKFALTEDADTLSYWTTLDQAYPVEFHYGNTNECDATGWHVAIKQMKYGEAQCEFICPSKLGFKADNNSVTPYVYIMKIKIKQ